MARKQRKTLQVFTPKMMTRMVVKKYDVFTDVITRWHLHDVSVAILVVQNNDTAAILEYRKNPVRIEFFSHVKTLLSSKKFA